MATVNSVGAFDMSTFDLYNVMSTMSGAPQILPMLYWPYDSTGTVYDQDIGIFYEGGTRLAQILGTGFTFSGAALSGGTIQAFSDANFPEATQGYLIEGTSISAADFYNAATTASTSDDYAILAAALSGADHFELGDGNDRVYGYAGNDVMNGNLGNDTLRGDRGSDVLNGGAGADVLLGGLGADALRGGLGKDVLRGGIDTARDYFIFDSKDDTRPGTARDVIFDFVSGKDIIQLNGIDSYVGVPGDQDFVWGGTTATKHGVWYTVSGADVIVWGDVNNDTTADFSILVKGVHSLTAGDFIL